jgi:hypothetical protein
MIFVRTYVCNHCKHTFQTDSTWAPLLNWWECPKCYCPAHLCCEYPCHNCLIKIILPTQEETEQLLHEEPEDDTPFDPEELNRI